MKNKRNWLGMLVITLVFGMMVVGCTDSKLNGTWSYDDHGQSEYKFKNGIIEYSTSELGSFSRGTYTTKGNELEMTLTHYYGSSLGANRGYKLESKWYSLTELKSAIVPSQITEEDWNMSFGSSNKSLSLYSIDGDTLTLTNKWGDSKLIRISSGNDTKITKTESNSSNKGGSRITERSLVGVWELEDIVNVSRREASDKDEFFADGTGIMSQGSRNVPFTWKLRDGNRLQMDAMSETQISDIELSENGRLLTYYLDDAHSKKTMYRKK